MSCSKLWLVVCCLENLHCGCPCANVSRQKPQGKAQTTECRQVRRVCDGVFWSALYGWSWLKPWCISCFVRKELGKVTWNFLKIALCIEDQDTYSNHPVAKSIPKFHESNTDVMATRSFLEEPRLTLRLVAGTTCWYLWFEYWLMVEVYAWVLIRL